MAAAMQSELLPAAARAAAKSAAAADVASYAAYASALGLSAGEGALLTNGRLVPLATPLDAVDVGLLEEYEFRQRAEGAAKLISELDPGKSDVAAWRSSVLMHAVAELSRVAQRATQQSGRGDRKVQLQPDDLYPGCARTSAHPSTLLCCRDELLARRLQEGEKEAAARLAWQHRAPALARRRGDWRARGSGREPHICA